ncbi:MAG: Gfo/Idh/MocA family oxidoreductase, partial [Solirubrobacterales bacterium]|nr:Gfo/Idh/MocA family oxidoreductase [Solirubrobacterales bacterium]
MSAPTLRWGLLSTARINDTLLATDPDRARFRAVASRDADRAARYAEEHGLDHAHGSYEALLADEEVDAVYVGLPNALHAAWAIRALEAGKHVLCEKPLTLDPAEAQRAFTVAEERGLVLSEGLMWRHHPQAIRARELVAEGAIGELRTVHAEFRFTLADPADVRWQAALGGGALADLGCYCVSGCRTLAGREPDIAHGVMVGGGDGVDAAFTGLLRFPDDVLATFSCSMRARHGHVLRAVGSTGELRLEDPWSGRRPGIAVRGTDDGWEELPAPSQRSAYALELDDLEAAAAGVAPLRLGR